jgi:predicted secreted protein
MNGNNILIQHYDTNSSSWVVFAAVKSQEVQTEAGAIEIASATQQDWEEFIAGRKSWSINCNYLVLTNIGLKDLLYIGNKVQVRVITRGDSPTYLQGYALILQAKQTHTKGNLVTGSFAFKGTGPLVPST